MDKKDTKRIRDAAELFSGGLVAIIKRIFAIEDKIDTAIEKIKAESPDLYKILDTIKGKDGEDGNDYVITEDDKKEIAEEVVAMVDTKEIAKDALSLIPLQEISDKISKGIKVPIVEKITEKTETIREIPIVTNNVEVKEVAVTDSAEVIVEKINDLPTDNDDFKIDASHIKNLPKSQNVTKFNGLINGVKEIIAGTNITVDSSDPKRPIVSSTASGGGSGSGIITVSGTIDDSNVTFTSTVEPDILVINGGSYRPTGGAFTWSYSAGTITLSSPVGNNGNIYGMTSASAPTVGFTTPLNDGISLSSGDGVAYTTILDQYDGWEIVEVGASRVSGTGVPSIQIHNVTQGVDILSTNITIDSGETDSSTATTQPVINSSNKTVNSFDQLRFDVDNAGSSTLWCIIRVVLQRP